MGTSSFAVPILKKLIETKREIKCVFTSPDKPAGRGRKIAVSAVKQEALKHNLEILQPYSKGEIYLLLKQHDIDLVVIASYGMILTKDVTDHYLCLNIHPSLLPKYRGPSPVRSAILEGEKETGITIMVTQEKLDAGEILMQEKISIADNDTALDISEKLAMLGAGLTNQFLDKIIDMQDVATTIESQSHVAAGFSLRDKTIKKYGQKQDENKATHTKKISKEDGLIDWKKSPTKIHNQVRALYPWPGAYTFVKDKRVKIVKTKVDKNGILKILTVQPEGKKEMPYKDYILGHPPIR